MKNSIIGITIVATFASCTLISSESATDNRFVGVWKFDKAKTGEQLPDYMLQYFTRAMSFCPLQKVALTKEAYTFTDGVFLKLPTVFTKKDENLLVNEENSSLKVLDGKLILTFGVNGYVIEFVRLK